MSDHLWLEWELPKNRKMEGRLRYARLDRSSSVHGDVGEEIMFTHEISNVEPQAEHPQQMATRLRARWGGLTIQAIVVVGLITLATTSGRAQPAAGPSPEPTAEVPQEAVPAEKAAERAMNAAKRVPYSTRAQNAATRAQAFFQQALVLANDQKPEAAVREVVDDARKASEEAEDAAKKAEESTVDFKDLGFGVGVSFTVDLGPGDRVNEAMLVKNKDDKMVVRVKDEQNLITRLLLEIHYFFLTEETPFFWLLRPKMWGWGPFVGVQSGSDKVIDAVGGGMMLGFRFSEESDKALNFGFGAVVDPDVKTLGDGLKANAELPEGETEVRLKEEGRVGLLFVSSFKF